MDENTIKKSIFVVAAVLIFMVLTFKYTTFKYTTIKYETQERVLGVPTEYVQYVKATLGEDKVSFPGATILPILDTREDLGKLLEHEEKEFGIEVGVQRAEFAKRILNQWKSCKQYILIDPWIHQEHYQDIANQNQDNQNEIYQTAVDNMNSFKKRGTDIVFHRMFSVDAAKIIADNSVDFVYIDARHDYRGVSEDLRAFWPKLKKNGILAGHDFLNANEVRNHQDWCVFSDGTRCTKNRAVKAAVEEFARLVGRQPITFSRKTVNWPTWAIRK